MGRNLNTGTPVRDHEEPDADRRSARTPRARPAVTVRPAFVAWCRSWSRPWSRARAHDDPRVLLLGAVMIVVFAAQPDNDVAADLDPRAFDWLACIFVAAAAVTLLFRRSYPLLVVVANLVLLGWWNALGYTNGLINVASLVAYFTLGTTGDRRRQVLALVITAVPLVTYVVVAAEPWWWLLSNVGWPIAATLLGEISRSRRAMTDRYQRRAEQAEADREAEARRRVVEERLRIARDLHDLLGHTVSLMTVQANVAADKFDRTPALARAAIDHIRTAGRQANDEIRATIELLRGHHDEPTLAPTPAISGIEALAAGTARLGVHVECHVDPAAHDADPLVGLTVYRVVQEALTNVVRHANAERVSVDIGCRDGRLRCVVIDDGPVVGAVVVVGNGLRGMVERVALAGGTLHYGPAVTGGFEVVATFPARRGRP